MQKVRKWSVNNSRLLERFYEIFEPALVFLHPVWDRIGYSRIEKPVQFIEKSIKGLMFDCQMCGQCALSTTGMSCPMNCPKNLRNGPCGGVRMNGHCEVKPEMPCVWAEAWRGSRNMRNGERIQKVQYPIDFRLKDTSSWMRVVREEVEISRGGRNR